MTLKTIQRGATLSKMVAAHNKEFGTRLTVADVAKANGLKDANKIQAGKQMLFPDKFEKNAPQSVFRNADNKPVVRNGVNETVQVTSQQEQVKTSNQTVSSNITPRPLEKLPTQPVIANKQPELISTSNQTVSSNITPRPLEKLPTQPVIANKPPELVKTSTQTVSSNVTPRPLEKLPTAPTSTSNPNVETPKTTLSLSEFLAANKDQQLSVDSLRKNGVNAAKSDLNGDGVVSGQNELTSLFAQAEKADSNKDKAVADLTNTTVAKNFEGIGAAERMKAAPYSKLDLERVAITLKEGTPDRLGTVNPQTARRLGLSPGSTELTVWTPVDESRGLGNRTNSVTIYRDAQSGEYFKEYNNDADEKNTPLVPLSEAEKKILLGNTNGSLQANSPNEERMRGELFGFEYD